jgi:hypothetical protein
MVAALAQGDPERDRQEPQEVHRELTCAVAFKYWEGMVTMSGSAVPEDLYPAQAN